jgi:hypothetical protein
VTRATPPPTKVVQRWSALLGLLLALLGWTSGRAGAQTTTAGCRLVSDQTNFLVADGGWDARGNVIRFCSALREVGGLAVVGQAVSTPFRLDDGFTYQAFQRVLLRWQPDGARARHWSSP